MAGLYAARSARPDLNVPILRLARRITKWDVVDDAKLIRLLGYIKWSKDVGLRGQLSTGDLSTAVLRIWPDADLAGDPNEDSHSSSGSWIELASLDGDRFFPLHWSYTKQGFTAGHTQEAELASMFDTLRADGLPLASLLEFLLERDVVVEVHEDNAAAIVAARQGYSKRLRHLHQSKRIHVGYLGEVFDSENPQAVLMKADSKDHKGDLLTKEMSKARFEECKGMLQIVPIAVSLSSGVPQILICQDGVLRTVAACVAAAASMKKAKENAVGLCPGRNAWVVDSGSGNHLIQKADCSAEQLKRSIKAETALTLATANGHARAEWLVPCYVEELGIEIWAWLLTSTPKVLGLHLLIKDYGCKFEWSSSEVAILRKGRKKIFMPIVQGVPAMKYKTEEC